MAEYDRGYILIGILGVWTIARMLIPKALGRSGNMRSMVHYKYIESTKESLLAIIQVSMAHTCSRNSGAMLMISVRPFNQVLSPSEQ